MRRLKIGIRLIFVTACLVLAGYLVKTMYLDKNAAPEILCEEEVIEVSVQDEDMDAALKKGLTATDDKDGDITEHIRVASMGRLEEDNSRNVKYIVFDSSNQACVLERTVTYTDYVSPKIYMSKAFRYDVSLVYNTSFANYLTAEDCLDGDLTNQIRVNLGEDYNASKAGDYAVTIQVNNSAGDVCLIPAELTIIDSSDAAEKGKYYPLLSDYIVYTTVGKKLDLEKYIIGLEVNGVQYTYEEEYDIIGDSKEQIEVISDIDYKTPGTYVVEYRYTSQNGFSAVTKQYVVVEGAS